MKKMLLLLFTIIFFTGCQLLEKNPTKEIRLFLNRYKDNDTTVKEELDIYLGNEELEVDELKEYKKIYLRQYSDMEYVIKDTTIDGDDATVTVEITVYDYYKSNKESGEYFNDNQSEFINDKGDIDYSKFMKYKIKKLLSTEDRITYTITFNLKHKSKKWEIEPLNEEVLEKIHGTYEY